MNVIPYARFTVVAIMSSIIDSVFGASCPFANQFPACKVTTGTNPTLATPVQGGTANRFTCANGETPCCAASDPKKSQVRAQDCNNIKAPTPSAQCPYPVEKIPACQNGQTFSSPKPGGTANRFFCAGTNSPSCCSKAATPTTQPSGCVDAQYATFLCQRGNKFGGCNSGNNPKSPVSPPSGGDATSSFSCPQAASPVCCEQRVPPQGFKESTGCTANASSVPEI